MREKVPGNQQCLFTETPSLFQFFNKYTKIHSINILSQRKRCPYWSDKYFNTRKTVSHVWWLNKLKSLWQDAAVLILCLLLSLRCCLWILAEDAQDALDLLRGALAAALSYSEHVVQEDSHEDIEDDVREADAVVSPSGVVADGNLGEILVGRGQRTVPAVGQGRRVCDDSAGFGSVWSQELATGCTGWWLHYGQLIVGTDDWSSGDGG